ncbi:hypothetical protein ACGFNX_40205 [Streptomyces sp. NPDC048723]|uniref:hypothetical protein n=1 Tax=Streptomyces sp. NPDC048723 TaxID=3365589 RepID=UPI0037185D72
MVGAGARLLGIRLHPGAAAAALVLSGITHYIADRRVPGGVLEQLADKTGKGNFFRLADRGLNGAYALDLLCTKSVMTTALWPRYFEKNC